MKTKLQHSAWSIIAASSLMAGTMKSCSSEYDPNEKPEVCPPRSTP